MQKFIPWWLKIPAKIVLSRLPFCYGFWKKLGLFEHGLMNRPDYAYQVFKKHYQYVQLKPGFVALELGPGDSLFSAMIARAFGASFVYLIDVGNFLSCGIDQYRKMGKLLHDEGMSFPEIQEITSVKKVLELCNARYMTSGIEALRNIPDRSVDFILSQAVLEHIRRSEFEPLMVQLRRVIRENGSCSHSIDLRDHLGGALNHLRFSREFWQSDFIANSGFYTNRIRFCEMLKIFRSAGFGLEVVEVETWQKLPISREKLAREFRHFTDEELAVSSFDAILKPL